MLSHVLRHLVSYDSSSALTQYKTIGAVLDAATIIHPELANAIETIISTAKKDAADNRSNNDKEESSIVEKISMLFRNKYLIEPAKQADGGGTVMIRRLIRSAS